MHDVFCNCYNPVTHTAAFLFEKEPELTFSTPEKDLIQKCLSGDAATPAGEDADTLEAGDLDTLFKEPFEEEDATG